jgi:hypothetical protein
MEASAKEPLMKKAYDTQHAKQLLPLLESIVREVADRLHEIRVIQGRLAAFEDVEATPEFFDLKAALSNHRREIRLATAELERLGCVVDEKYPLRIIIPGTDGNPEFQWDPGELILRRLATGTVVS